MYAGPVRNDGELAAAIRLAAEVFHPNLEDAARIETKHFLTVGNPGVIPTDVIVLVNETGNIVGTTVLVDREMPREGAKLPVTYLTSVCIGARWQGHGLSRDLMTAAITACRLRGAAMALLIARRAVDNYYTEFGFWGLSSYNRVAITISPSDRFPDSMRLRRAKQIDFKCCGALYDSNYNSVFGHQHREMTNWVFLEKKLQRLDVSFLVADGPDGVSGYLIASGRDVHEFAVHHSLRPIDLLGAYAARSATSRLTVTLPPRQACASALGQDMARSSRECRYGGHMGMVIDRRKLIEASRQRIRTRMSQLRAAPFVERLDSIEFIWDGQDASVSAPASQLDFLSTARLFGATQLSMHGHQSVLDPTEPFNILLADQV